MKNISNNTQAGAVSLFVVVFFMLLITVVTVSFLRLMTADQQQSSDNDLSQSAYDSAQAGVEDAKRTLLSYKQYCVSNTASQCQAAGDINHLSTAVCNAALSKAIGAGTTPSEKVDEVLIQQSTRDDAELLNQAYTCVTIDLETDDYVGNVAANESQLVPLVSSSQFDRVRVEWFSREDVSSNAISLNGLGVSGHPLYTTGRWPVNRPSLMRAQLVQVATSGFTIASFDTVSGAQSNGASMFLYPTAESGIGALPMTSYDQRKTSPTDNPNPKDDLTTPTAVSCQSSLSSGGFACTATLVLPQAIGATDNQRTAFLRLVPLYNSTHFRVTLWNGPTVAKFSGVQPAVDSTGRANDLFRRIESRVDLYDTTFPYPEAAIDLTGNFCKDFAVTDTQYIGSSGCNP